MAKFELTVGNGKLNTYARSRGWTANQVAGIAFPAGDSCTFAHACKFKADELTGKLTDLVPETVPWIDKVHCFDAKGNARYVDYRRKAWRNFRLAKEIVHDLPLLTGVLFESLHSLDNKRSQIRSYRTGAGGENFFHMNMYWALRSIATVSPEIEFWGYSKNYMAVKHLIDNPLDNFKMVYSIGGRPEKDKMMLDLNIPHCRVVKSYEHAAMYGLPVICDGEDDDYVNDVKHIQEGKSYAIIAH